MNKWLKIVGSLLLAVLLINTVVSCDRDTQLTRDNMVDYAAELKFDETITTRKRLKTTVHAYVNGDGVAIPNSGCIDGDTVHFDIAKDDVFTDGIIKARFLCVDTPESTGKVQPWGGVAKNFTKEKLKTAVDIIIESESNKWDVDSTGGRYLLYVWYRDDSSKPYRNLNLELMQEGLAAAKNITTTIYAEYFQKALEQAKTLKLKYWGETDETYPKDSDTTMIDVKELSTNAETYLDRRVRFEGLISRVEAQTAYVQTYYPDELCYYGFPVYMGYDHYTKIKVGNIVSFCGLVQYYEQGETYQVSGIQDMVMKPDHPNNLRLIEENQVVPITEIFASDFTNEAKQTQLMSTNCMIQNLTVTSVYTTNNGGDNDGAMTLTCVDENNVQVEVRTSVLYKADKKTKVIDDDLRNQKITVKGIFEKYGSNYQLHVFAFTDITFVE